jgi:hypothetical protein
LIFEPRRALGRENAHGIIYIQADGEVARFFSDRNWRGHYEGSEDVELRGIGQAHVDAPKIQGDGIRRVGFQQRQFCRAADVNGAAAWKIQPGVT